MDVNYEYYKIFYYVAKHNSFTKAARVLGNSQPNITPCNELSGTGTTLYTFYPQQPGS